MNREPSSERDEEQEHEKWYERTWYQILLFAVGIVLFVLFVGFVLNWYIDPQKASQRKDLAQALGLITAGVAGAVGIFFTWRGQRITREAQEDNQKNTQEQLKQSRRGQITERFTQAIEQLGATEEGEKNLPLRLGGIYSLERTAREDRDYHWSIMEVLTTYIRTDAGWWEGKDWREDLGKPDIQAILTVIGRRSVYHRDVEYGPIDLHHTNLPDVDLAGANLSGANLSTANLSRKRTSGERISQERTSGKHTSRKRRFSGRRTSGERTSRKRTPTLSGAT
jgi:Pentapeptide repeats (8 copies)